MFMALVAILALTLVVELTRQADPANAAITYALTSEFGSFERPTGVTVDQLTGNLYVADSKANVVDILGSEGGSPVGGLISPLTGGSEHLFNFARFPNGMAIDESGGSSNRDLYVDDSGHGVVDKFQLNGITHEYEYVCQFTGVGEGCKSVGGVPTWVRPAGAAVDTAGNLYVVSLGPSHGALYEFDSNGVDIRQITGQIGVNSINEPVRVAVAPDNTIYVNNYHSEVIKITPGGIESVLDAGGSTAVAVDAAEDVFVDDGTYVVEYDAAGKQVARFGEGLIGESEGPVSEGIAVNSSTGAVYVTDRATETIKEFHSVVIPDVSTCEVENVGKTTATLTGVVNPDEAGEAHYFFQYHDSEESFETPVESAGSGSSSVPVSVALTGLRPETLYSCRLVASNANGSNSGSGEMTFTTPPAVTFKPCPPINLHSTSVTLCVLINPEGSETYYGFAYGLEERAAWEEYEHFTGFEAAGAGSSQEQLTASIAELQPATTYHDRVVTLNELNGFSETVGEDEIFTTPPAEPTINDEPPFATAISVSEATFNGTVNPGRGVTSYHFEYGTSTEYGESTPLAYAPLNYEDDGVEQVVSGLSQGTVYHYRLIATNSSGTATGSDETFTTLSENPPTVETGTASQISTSTATITGIVDPAGQTATYAFEVGTSESYGTQLFGAIASREEVTAGLTGLLPETVYHYRLVASDAAGIIHGADRTFTTSGFPVTIVQPGTPALLPIPVFPPEKPIHLPPVKCKKGFVKKGGKCVKKHHKPARKKHKRK
jgi:hypothetical protein